MGANNYGSSSVLDAEENGMHCFGTSRNANNIRMQQLNHPSIESLPIAEPIQIAAKVQKPLLNSILIAH